MERINIGCSIPNRNPVNMTTKLSLEDTIKLIKLKNYNKDIEEDLIKQVKARPSNVYENFLLNINTYIAKIKEKYDRKNEEKANGESS